MNYHFLVVASQASSNFLLFLSIILVSDCDFKNSALKSE